MSDTDRIGWWEKKKNRKDGRQFKAPPLIVLRLYIEQTDRQFHCFSVHYASNS